MSGSKLFCYLPREDHGLILSKREDVQQLRWMLPNWRKRSRLWGIRSVI